MDTPGAGHLLRSDKVSWLKRDALLFNVSIGCRADELQYLYVWHTTTAHTFTDFLAQELNDDFKPFPTFPLGLGLSRRPLAT